MKITVFGAGYIGLATSAVMAQSGHDVLCYDTDQRKVRDLQNSICPVYEPGLAELLAEQIQKGKLQFSEDLPQSMIHASVYFITVGTPAQSSGQTDLTALWSLVEVLPHQAPKDFTLFIKSTVPVGTNKKIYDFVCQYYASQRGVSFGGDVVSSPEFLSAGKALPLSTHPERLVFGVNRHESLDLIKEIFADQLSKNIPFITTNPATSELSKYAANVMLAARVALMNEFARLSDAHGANICEIQHVLSLDHRIGPHFLQAGIGFGGSCLSKDLQSISFESQALGLESPIIQVCNQSNELHLDYILARIQTEIPLQKKLAVWGLAFKAGTDDLRESPALKIVNRLQQSGYQMKIHDPMVPLKQSQHHFGCFENRVADKMEALVDADALLILTDWQEYKDAQFTEMNVPIIFDGRNCLDHEKLRRLGIKVIGIVRNCSA